MRGRIADVDLGDSGSSRCRITTSKRLIAVTLAAGNLEFENESVERVQAKEEGFYLVCIPEPRKTLPVATWASAGHGRRNIIVHGFIPCTLEATEEPSGLLRKNEQGWPPPAWTIVQQANASPAVHVTCRRVMDYC